VEANVPSPQRATAGGAPADASVSLRFAGTWRLISFEAQDATGEVTYPMGPDVTGVLMYDRAEHMAVRLMRPGRHRFASADPVRGSPTEIKAAFEGFLAYYGTYTADPARGTVTHHIVGCSFPNWVGTAQERHFRFDGDHLTLSTPVLEIAGRRVVSVLLWERVA
jgi:hypothetical protein